MKKTIFNVILAFSFIILSIVLVIALNFDKIKDNSDKVVRIQKSKDDFGFNLPIVVINTGNEKLNRDKKVRGNIKIFNNEEKVLNYLSDEPELVSDINIKIRGNSSANYPKLQYSIELIKENGEKRNKKVIDMPKESDWVLNGPFADKSLIRNYLAYSVSREIMEYAPRTKFCEVFVINDGGNDIKKEHYKGLYLMIEKIKIGDDRVDINERYKESDQTSFIASKDRVKNDVEFRTYGKQTYIYDNGVISRYPNEKIITEGNVDYINREISKFERVLYGEKFNDQKEGFRKYIDENTFIDYYIINEFFQNTDAGVFSTYFYKDYGDKIKAGPVWDFNIAMGNNTVTGDYYISDGFYMNQTSWFDRLLEDKLFVTSLIGRYKILRKTYLSDEYLLKKIDDAVKEIGEAKNRNFSVWPIELCNEAEAFVKYGGINFKELNNNPQKLKEYFKENPKYSKANKSQAITYEEEIEKLKGFLIQRGKWLDENIEKLYKWTK